MSDWVKVGAEVVTRYSGLGRKDFGPIQKISKVYKTGNFLLEGSPDQWRPASDRAYRTGGYRYGGSCIYPLNEETRREMDRHNQVRAAQKVVYEESQRLARLAREDGDDLLAAADQITARKAATDK